VCAPQRSVLTSYDSSVVPTEDREADIAPVVDAFQRPLAEMARLPAATLPTLEAAVVQLNCLHAIQVPRPSAVPRECPALDADRPTHPGRVCYNGALNRQNVLILFPFTSSRAQALEAQINDAVAAVAAAQHALVVRVCGLAPVLDAIARNSQSAVKPLTVDGRKGPRRRANDNTRSEARRHHPLQAPQPLSRVPSMDARTLSLTMDTFHAQLFTLSPESFYAPGVVSTRLGRQAAQQAVALFVASYQYDRAAVPGRPRHFANVARAAAQERAAAQARVGRGVRPKKQIRVPVDADHPDAQRSGHAARRVDARDTVHPRGAPRRGRASQRRHGRRREAVVVNVCAQYMMTRGTC